MVIIGNKADKGIYVEKTRVLRDWVDSGKAVAYVEASAMKYIGIEDAFSKIGNFAFQYQSKLRENDNNAMKHSIINIS